MPKRRTHDSGSRYGAEDNPIGLTGAFSPVKGPQSVDYDVEDDPVGLTQAFGAVQADEEPPAWAGEDKWKDFDWDAAFGEPVGDYSEPDDDSAGAESAPDGVSSSADSIAHSDEGGEGLPESSSNSDGSADSEEDELPGDSDSGGGTGDAGSSSKAAEAADASGTTPGEERSEREKAAPAPKPKPVSTGGPKHGRHAAAAPELSPRMKRSRRTRRVLIVLVILLILVACALGYFIFRTFTSSQQEAAQQAQEQVATPRDDIGDAPTDDAVEAPAKLASVPDLSKVLGMNQDDAIKAIGRGALITANHEVNEENNPIKHNLNVALTDEAADSKTGTPTVYLGVAEDGRVLQAGYSASASALGFGSLSFVDAVNNEHVVEKTLDKVGVKVGEGSAVLPENKDEYSTYASDGTTVVRERCSFEGDVDVNGIPCVWSAVLSYDYTTQVVTGNLSDTVRIIYVYITAK